MTAMELDLACLKSVKQFAFNVQQLYPEIHLLINNAVAPIAYFFMRSPKQGSQTAIYCATEPALERQSGLLYRNCSQYISKVTFDDNVALKLWNESERLINEKMK
ncbi:hypothetical protein MTP99_014102 [Tenebrio molitor]|nr:hypothetical protein MTP99_014102 [Tenebrio molitor]